MPNPPERSRPAPPWLIRLALGLAIVRYVVPLAAVPLIPLLVRDRLPLLLVLRPTKEFMLLGGGLSRIDGVPSIVLLFALYAPLMLLTIWPFFVVGRAYRSTLLAGEGPGWLHRALPQRQLELARGVLVRRGPSIAILGRVAAIAPTMLAAAAGVSDVGARRYLVADVIGGVVAFVITVGAGFALGHAYEEAGIWLTAAGAVVFAALVVLLARWIRHEALVVGERRSPADGPSPVA